MFEIRLMIILDFSKISIIVFFSYLTFETSLYHYTES